MSAESPSFGVLVLRTTGHGESVRIPPERGPVPMIRMPCAAASLQHVLAAALRRA